MDLKFVQSRFYYCETQKTVNIWIVYWANHGKKNVQYERFECRFHNFKNDIQHHEILRLKFVVKLDPSLNWVRPEM